MVSLVEFMPCYLRDMKPRKAFPSGNNSRCRVIGATMRDIIAKNVRGVLIMNETKTVLLTNPATETIFGCTNKELVGRVFDLPLEPGEAKEMKMLTREGKPITVEIWTIKTEWAGKPAYYVAIHDITKRKVSPDSGRRRTRSIKWLPDCANVNTLSGCPGIRQG